MTGEEAVVALPSHATTPHATDPTQISVVILCSSKGQAVTPHHPPAQNEASTLYQQRSVLLGLAESFLYSTQ